ncbi:MAG: hypothetical protein OXI92_00060 [Acidobacteriota bacterium]|nr:hypothetical protein [Acidobacteriota bacterium]
MQGQLFTPSSIQAFAPASSGVYLIYWSQLGEKVTAIYVGESDNIREALLSHCRRTSEEAGCIWSHSPTSYACQTVWMGEALRKHKHGEWIEKFQPVCNR